MAFTTPEKLSVPRNPRKSQIGNKKAAHKFGKLDLKRIA
jgi:hypothetical protein